VDQKLTPKALHSAMMKGVAPTQQGKKKGGTWESLNHKKKKLTESKGNRHEGPPESVKD